MNEKVLDYLNKEIDALDKELDIMIEQRNLPKESSFEDIGLDEDGIPRSQGNSDDVYNDGFKYGCDQGHYDCLVELKTYLESLN